VLILFVAMGVFLTTLLRAVQNSRRTAEQQLAHIAEEVAGRARAQAELEQHNAEKRALLDSIGDAFAAFDFDWRYTYVNDTAVQFARTPREQLLGRSVWEVFPDLVGSAFEQTARRVIADRHTSRLSFFYPPFDRWFEIDFYPSKNGLSLFCRDITDAVQLAAERDRLLSRERQQAALLNLAHDAILAITVEGRIDFWNHGAERMYGWTAAEAVGQVAHNLLRTVFPQPLADIQHTLLVDGTWAGQLTHTCRDGTEVVSADWASWRVVPRGNKPPRPGVYCARFGQAGPAWATIRVGKR
jgi:PAS domain S-box-containing protein